jgi:hypothetical protein
MWVLLFFKYYYYLAIDLYKINSEWKLMINIFEKLGPYQVTTLFFLGVQNFKLLQKNWTVFVGKFNVFVENFAKFRIFFQKIARILYMVQLLRVKIHGDIWLFLFHIFNSQIWLNQLLRDDHHLSYITKLKNKHWIWQFGFKYVKSQPFTMQKNHWNYIQL